MNLIDLASADLSGMDCHIHSVFSPDAKNAGADDPQGVADAVRKKGLKGFIITDHLDVGHWNGYIIDFDKYFSAWEKVRRDNPDLTIYIGLEVGFETEFAEKTYKLINGLPFEYIINSVHYWHRKTADGEADEWSHGRIEAYNRYLDCVLASLDCPYRFSAVGHLGFPERYAPYPVGQRELTYELFGDRLDRIINKALSRGAIFEENTNAGGEMRLPRERFLRKYKAKGGTRPVLGSDAHVSNSIGQYFDVAKNFLDGIFDE